jgi:hypothetical protein
VLLQRFLEERLQTHDESGFCRVSGHIVLVSDIACKSFNSCICEAETKDNAGYCDSVEQVLNMVVNLATLLHE